MSWVTSSGPSLVSRASTSWNSSDVNRGQQIVLNTTLGEDDRVLVVVAVP